MSSIFGDETIPAGAESPEEGHDEAAAVDTESEEAEDIQDDVDAGEEADEQDADGSDSEDGEDATEHSDDLLAGKYKTTEDLVRGYKELERSFHQQRQGNQQPAAQPPAVQQPGAQPGQQPDQNDIFWSQFREDPFGTMQSLVQFAVTRQTAPIFEERQTETAVRHLQDISKEYAQVATSEGLGQLVGKAREIAAELGNTDHMNPRILRMAAQEAFPQSKAQLYKQAKDAARAETERARQSKQGLGAPKGAKAQADPEMTEEQATKAGILAAGRGGGLFG